MGMIAVVAATLKPLNVVARTKGCCHPVAPAIEDGRAVELADVFRALGDPTRIQIVHMLAAATEPLCVCDFTAAFSLGQPTISHHLAKLRDAGVVESARRGIWSFYRLHPSMPAAARAALRLAP